MSPTAETHLVTGAFGFTGRYIAQSLLDSGHEVRTLTRSQSREHPFGDRVRAYELDFESPHKLTAALEGVRVLYNTYWVRFSKAGFSQTTAVANTVRLFEAARQSSVERIVHVSITNPSEDSPYEYFRGKAVLERRLVESGVSHTILRPAVIFGHGDILVNNIAWMLRRFPVFGVFGDGKYRLQPIHVEDFAALAVREGRETRDRTVDAIGPETFTYRELVAVIARAIGARRPIVRIPAFVGLAMSWVVGCFVRDVLLTREEIAALMDDLLACDSQPQGQRKLSEWVREHAATVGVRYASELARRR